LLKIKNKPPITASHAIKIYTTMLGNPAIKEALLKIAKSGKLNKSMAAMNIKTILGVILWRFFKRFLF